MARALLSSHAPPFAVQADTQIEGYGQQGRRWESPLGNLYITLALPLSSTEVPMLLTPLRAALTLTRWIEATWGLRISLKWPNDLIYGGAKVGGILCETSLVEGHLSSVCIGIGLNLTQKTTGAEYPIVTLSEILSTPLPSVAELTKELLEAWPGLWEMNQTEILTHYERFSLGPGQLWVSEGRFYRDRGISEMGFLQLESLEKEGAHLELISATGSFRWAWREKPEVPLFVFHLTTEGGLLGVFMGESLVEQQDIRGQDWLAILEKELGDFFATYVNGRADRWILYVGGNISAWNSIFIGHFYVKIFSQDKVPTSRLPLHDLRHAALGG